MVVKIAGGGGAPRKATTSVKPGTGPGTPRTTSNTFQKAMTAQAPINKAATQLRAPLSSPAPAPAPTAIRSFSAPAPAPRVDGGGGGGGALGSFAAPAVPSVDEYQANDSILSAALAALDRAMADYNAQADTDTQNYERDYGKGLNNLGWRDTTPDDGMDNPGWDWNDVLTSSGRAFQNQSNDFASRGMLQSQGYADALQLLNRSLGDQKTAMETGRTDFLSDIGRKKTEFGNQDTLARQQARAEATARRAAEYGVA